MCEVEKEFFGREMRRLQGMNGAIVATLREDLQFARSELNECSEKISTLEFQNYVSTPKAD